MISLSTGLPGAGKTLYTIAFVKELSEREGRPVYYSGIKDLALPWIEIEPEKWYECPHGAIILIDECQRIFRPRGSGAKVPEFVSRLETHRHDGHDIFLITQHPMLMDANVRRLTERHSHISRRFGMHRATILQFESCKEQPLVHQQQAQRLEWKYPKEVFSYYKSAEVHTVKRRLPVQYFVMFLAPLVVIGLGYVFVSRYYQNGEITAPWIKKEQKEIADAKPTSTTPVPSPSAPSSSIAQSDKKRPMTTAEYIEAHQPRIEGLAYTAPVYDEVTKPDEAPIPVACVTSKTKGCQCWSQQATRLHMPEQLCEQIVKNGFFKPFGNRKLENEGRGRERGLESPVAQQREPQASPHLPPTAPVSLSQTFPQANDSTNPRYNVALRGQP